MFSLFYITTICKIN